MVLSDRIGYHLVVYEMVCILHNYKNKKEINL